MPLAPRTRLGPYEIVELAGAGGMGEFYKAHDTRLRRAVALKIATGSFGDDGETRGQFEREARAIAALNHPHICAIHDVASFDGHDVIVMEYLDGETLQQRLRRGPLPIPELLRHAIAIADGAGRGAPRGCRASGPQALERDADADGRQTARLRHRQTPDVR
jgi:serine/threonine protein kinase